MENKYLTFEFLCHQLYYWYYEGIKETNNIDQHSNDLSKLKVMKLLFFITAASSSESDVGLLEIFNNFYALPLGPVESDIYNYLNACTNLSINRYGMTISEPISKSASNITELKVIGAIDRLKEFNTGLVHYSAMELVDLSHRWSSWKVSYRKALEQGKKSYEIPIACIQKDIKFFG